MKCPACKCRNLQIKVVRYSDWFNIEFDCACGYHFDGEMHLENVTETLRDGNIVKEVTLI